ncbi:hypothetical protein ABMY26_23740 [Azospirillum sp. HJ39]|uniref:hypothetical protein n=1 Tax=Azospirillum sp. HJ39 TaxID=3159496 RepID=UPI0035567C7D
MWCLPHPPAVIHLSSPASPADRQPPRRRAAPPLTGGSTGAVWIGRGATFRPVRHGVPFRRFAGVLACWRWRWRWR